VELAKGGMISLSTPYEKLDVQMTPGPGFLEGKGSIRRKKEKKKAKHSYLWLRPGEVPEKGKR